MTAVRDLFEQYRMRCEGAGANGNHVDNGVRCQMCNRWFEGHVVLGHDRFDLIKALDDGALDNLTVAEAAEIATLEWNA